MSQLGEVFDAFAEAVYGCMGSTPCIGMEYWLVEITTVCSTDSLSYVSSICIASSYRKLPITATLAG